MADFVQTMKDWRRMCDSMQGQKAACTKCPLGADLCKGPWQEEKMPPWELAERRINTWAAEHPEPVYPTWGEWLEQQGICFSRLTNYSRVDGISIPQVFNYQIEGKTAFICGDKVNEHISADMAQKLGVEPKEGV